jgi:uncharacterized protein YxeA
MDIMIIIIIIIIIIIMRLFRFTEAVSSATYYVVSISTANAKEQPTYT